ncbi:MAG: C40 family peptidase [Ruminococcus sp.]|uniref:NlpC/P60 family protein n=1 Tax=Ruminococcus sp. TaxID=41978 RepID=UPI0025CFB522|nr:NlpC/P60 family protein [Ruminococcus sp.]MBO4865545.1 C40 family peptidase [Ruminococcus sp.]
MITNKYTVKKAIALCLALTIAAGVFGGAGKRDTAISTAAAPQQEQDQYETELELLKAEQEALDKKIAEADAEFEKQKGDLKALKARYTAVKAKIDNVEEQLAKNEDAMVELDTRLRNARNDLETKNKEIEVLKDEFMKRLKSMYVAGGVSTYENVLVNSTDFFDVLMRFELVKRVASHDDEALDTLMEKKREIEEVKAEIEENSEKLKKQTAEYSDMMEELNAEKKSLKELIDSADGKLDTMALDKAALELRSSQLTEARKTATTTTTTAPTTTIEDKNDESSESEASSTKHTTAPSEDEPEDTPTETTKKKTTTTIDQEEPEPEPEPVPEPQPEPEPEPEPQPEPEPEPEPQPVDDSRQSRINTVMDYARSNVGGAYVWGGSSFRANDCSGLVMLSYSQIGINLPHLASSQAGYGTAVSYGDLQEGDLIFFGYGGIGSIYHVAIYNGNGRIVHAANSYDGIIFSDLASFSIYNPIVCMRRII